MEWIKRVYGFIKLYMDYGYEPETWRHIVDTYTAILCERTKLMSKPTYMLSDVLSQIDEWYYDLINMAVEELKKEGRW